MFWLQNQTKKNKTSFIYFHYPYQDFAPVEYQIKSRKQPGYSDRYSGIYETFHALIKVAVETHHNLTEDYTIYNPELSTLNSEMESELFENVEDPTFMGQESNLVLPLTDYLYEKQQQRLFATEIIEEIREQFPDGLDGALEKNVELLNLSLQEMKSQTYSVWYLLMVRSSFERFILQTTSRRQHIHTMIEEHSSLKDVFLERKFLAQNTDKEESAHQEILELMEKILKKHNDTFNQLKENLDTRTESMLQYLRTPKDPNYKKGLGTQYSWWGALKYNVLRYEHPRVSKNKKIIVPYLMPQDIYWSYQRLVEILLSQWEDKNNMLDNEYKFPHCAIFGFSTGEGQELCAPPDPYEE